MQLTSEKLQELEEACYVDPSPYNLHRVKLQARTVNVFFCKQRVFQLGERSGKLLAYLAHLNDKPPVVVSLVTPEGVTLTDPPPGGGKISIFL